MSRSSASSSQWLFLFGVALSAFPLVAEAKGRGFAIFSIVFTVALTIATWGAGSPLLVAAQAAENAGLISASTLSAVTAITESVAFQVVSGALALQSLATASNCLAGNNGYGYDSCGGGGGNQGVQAPASTQTEAAIDANTVTAQTTSPGVAYCQSGYTYSAAINQCVADGYISCASAGHPELVCPNSTSCTSGGQCQGQTGSCVGSAGSACSSAANSCGMTNHGTARCDGSCPAVVPGDNECAPPEIHLSETPSLVTPGETCTVSWTIANATSCSLSSNGSDSGLPMNASLPAGNYTSPGLNAQRIYTMFCHNGTVVTAQTSITCHLNPQINEL